MATKAQIQAALNEAMNRIVELEAHWAKAEMQAMAKVARPKALFPQASRREVMAAAKAQAMASGRAVLAA
jgi:siroheme synthase (precorrin-2 oxidase/ferrochelatase)